MNVWYLVCVSILECLCHGIMPAIFVALMPVLSDVWWLQGYVVGTYLYFAIVFSLPICMGLAAVAMDLPVSLHLLLLLSRLLMFPVTLCCFHLVPCPALPCPVSW